MLQAKNRLRLLPYKNKENFKGQRVSGDDLVLVYQKNEPVFKATCVITKKIAPKAVDRNRIKRLILRALVSQTGRNVKAVVIVKKNIASLKAGVVEREIEELFKKIK